MTQIKLLKLITGHNTSFSALIRRLIGNRLACFSRSTFPLCIWRTIQKVTFQHRWDENRPPHRYFASITPEHGLQVYSVWPFLEAACCAVTPPPFIFFFCFCWFVVSPHCTVAAQTLHDFNAAWQSETDGDWHTSFHLSALVSSCVIYFWYLKSLHSWRSAVDTWGHWRHKTLLSVCRNWAETEPAVPGLLP